MSPYHQGILTLISINVTAVLGVSLLTGFTGLFSFGHAGFMSVGAYAAAILTVRQGLPFFISLPLAGAAAAIVSLIMYPTLKLKGDYFAIAALGFGEAFRLIVENGGKFTGGARGFPGMPHYTTIWVGLPVAAMACLLMRNIILSRFGRSFMAIREDRLAAEALGIDVARYQMLSLAISAFYAGVGGGMFAFYMQYIQPIMFDIAKSTELAASVVFGGLGSLTGSVVAAVILTAIPEVFRPLAQWRMVFYGLALVLTIVIRPQGLMGFYELSLGGLRSLVKRPGRGAGA